MSDSQTSGNRADGTSFEYAVTPWRRFRGLLFGPQKADVLVLEHCCDIHTFGMRRMIDVAFVDKQGLVLESHRDVRSGVRMRYPWASAVYERYASPEKPWPMPGDVIEIAPRAFGGARKDAREEREGIECPA